MANRNEPKPFIEVDKVSQVIVSIRQNSFYNPSLIKEYDLSDYAEKKKTEKEAEKARKEALQKLIEFAMENNCSRFDSASGHTASFSSDGKLLLKEPKEKSND